MAHRSESRDLEKSSADELKVTFGWKNISYSVPSKTGTKHILQNVSGFLKSGELLAILGPSGCGKSTLLNILSRRLKGPEVSGDQLLNQSHFHDTRLRSLSTYVEQEDCLVGSLTVAETVSFAAKLALPTSLGAIERAQRTDDMIREFGLESVRDTWIGTPLKRGVSGGEKRRVTTASQLITLPKIIFLDEPTSGLDSASAFEIISCLQNTAKEYNMLVIASIHQPSTNTLLLFDNVLLLSGGKTVYYGPPANSVRYFISLGHPPPPLLSPAEFMLELANTNFNNRMSIQDWVTGLCGAWEASLERKLLLDKLVPRDVQHESDLQIRRGADTRRIMKPFILLHRMAIKSYRDPLAYGVRIAMYLGLAILMGTGWLRLSYSETNIQNVLNSLFFGSAFMSFMAVAYIPAFLEDRGAMVQERANGLYGPIAFLIANFLIGLPFLFIITLLFTAVSYPLINLRPGAEPFFNYLGLLYVDLIAAESLVILISSVFPIFVVALALTAFANGLWMTVGGFLVDPTALNVFWRYTFYQIDYQRYTFAALVRNQMIGSIYTCGADCHCQFVTSLADQCLIDGSEAVEQLGYTTSIKFSYAMVVVLAVGMRALAGIVLYLKRK